MVIRLSNLAVLSWVARPGPGRRSGMIPRSASGAAPAPSCAPIPRGSACSGSLARTAATSRDLLILLQKSAWHLAHRIRETYGGATAPFSGPIDVDGTYVGGRETNKHASERDDIGRRDGISTTGIAHSLRRVAARRQPRILSLAEFEGRCLSTASAGSC